MSLIVLFVLWTVSASAATIQISEPTTSNFSTGTLSNVTGSSTLTLSKTEQDAKFVGFASAGVNPGPSPSPATTTLVASGNNDYYIDLGWNASGTFYDQAVDYTGGWDEPTVDNEINTEYDHYDVTSERSHTVMSALYSIYIEQGVASNNGIYCVNTGTEFSFGTGWKAVNAKPTIIKAKGSPITLTVSGYGAPGWTGDSPASVAGGGSGSPPELQITGYSTFNQYAPNGQIVTWENKGGLVSGDQYRIYYATGSNLTASQIITNNTYVTSLYNTTSATLSLAPGNYSTVVVEEQNVSGTFYQGAVSNTQNLSLTSLAYTAGKFGQAAVINNQGQIQFDPSNVNTQNGTVETYVEPTTTSPTASILCDIAGSGNNGLQLGIDSTNHAYIQAGTGSGTIRATSTSQIPTGVYSGIEGVWTPTGVNIYVNGTRENTTTGSTAIIVPSTGSIGSQTTTQDNFFAGNIDDTRISDIDRGTSQISLDYAMGLQNDGNTSYLFNFDNNLQSQYGGQRISPVYDISTTPQTLVQNYSTSWTDSASAGQSVNLYSNISLDNGATWQGWQLDTNGGAIPGITSVTNLSQARLQLKEVLLTTSSQGTPSLSSVITNVDTATPYTTFNVTPSAETINTGPANTTSATVNISVQTNIFNSTYAVYMYEDNQPTATSGNSLAYVTSGPSIANGFIFSQAITNGFGYTEAAVSGSPILPSGFNNGNDYTSFAATTPDTIVTGSNGTANINDSVNLKISAFPDYMVRPGTYTNTVTLVITQAY